VQGGYLAHHFLAHDLANLLDMGRRYGPVRSGLERAGVVLDVIWSLAVKDVTGRPVPS